MNIYKGILLFSEVEVLPEGTWTGKDGIESKETRTEYATEIVFDLDDVKELSRYCYSDRFNDFKEKTWVTFSSDRMIIIAEDFEVILNLWIKRRINPKIYLSKSLKTFKFENRKKVFNQ